MEAWWNSLSGLAQFFYCIAVPATLILLIQFILSIIGLTGGGDVDTGSDVDADGDADADIGSADFQLVSFRTIVAFLTVFPWTGIMLLDKGYGTELIFLLSTLSGFAAMAGIGYLLYAIGKLQYSGNQNYQNAIGKTAEVYIPMLKENGYSGKVQVILQGQLIEANAIARDQKEHKTGEIVMTVGVSGLSTLLVESEIDAQKPRILKREGRTI